MHAHRPRVRCALVFSLCTTSALADDVLIEAGADWAYLDDGTDQGTAWTGLAYDDSGWAVGPAQLGYGDGDEDTVVSFGTDSDNKYPTTYFRHSFDVPDPTVYSAVTVEIQRDDGVLIHVNGAEVYRDNMKTGSIDYLTFAESTIGDYAEDTFFYVHLPATVLQAGPNVVAVEIHQCVGDSSDISFDLQLTAVDDGSSAAVIRGPYLQRGGQTEVTVKWTTSVPTDARIQYGTSFNNQDQTLDDLSVGTDHEIRVTGLGPGLTYYYTLGSTSTTLSGGTRKYYWLTDPGVATQMRVWVLGDSGTGDDEAASVRDAYVADTTGATDLVLMLGDNAYDDGLLNDYEVAVFDVFPNQLRSMMLWPTLGNHDARSADSGSESGPYYDLFTLPRNGECGGLASGTEAYYAFDYANVHFVCLDSEDTSHASNDPMFTWLQNDLAATSQEWIIAFWHHPPYSKSSHDSDDPDDSGGRMKDMRERALPLLEDYGVDLVLCGHSHSYERSFLLDGHYDTSDTLTEDMILDGGDGRPAGDGVYEKGSVGLAHEGTVYAVVGCSGQTGDGPLDHPAMYFSKENLGSLVLDIHHLRLDARFLQQNQQVVDWFSISKEGPAYPTDGIVFSARLDGDIGGLAYDDGDLIAYDAVAGSFQMLMDISDVLTEEVDVDAACRLSDGSLLLSFNTPEDVDGLVGGPNGTLVEDEDLIRFIPTSLGAMTSGSFEFYFDGSDVGLVGADDAIDAVSVDGVGRLHLSLDADWNLGALSGRDEDVLRFDATQLGANTAGTFTVFLRGNDPEIRLAHPGENTDAYHHDNVTGELFLSTGGSFRVPVNLTGEDQDVLRFLRPTSSTTPGSGWRMHIDGTPIALPDLDALIVVRGPRTR